jgi:hypothetical protein
MCTYIHTYRVLCILRQHTSAYVSIRQHTSAYVSIRPHTTAYVSIRQHTGHTGRSAPSLSRPSPSDANALRPLAAWHLRCQHLYFCSSKASKLSTARSDTQRLRCQYSYFCTSKASKLSTARSRRSWSMSCRTCNRAPQLSRYLYFSTMH